MASRRLPLSAYLQRPADVAEGDVPGWLKVKMRATPLNTARWGLAILGVCVAAVEATSKPFYPVYSSFSFATEYAIYMFKIV